MKEHAASVHLPPHSLHTQRNMTMMKQTETVHIILAGRIHLHHMPLQPSLISVILVLLVATCTTTPT
jgi:hypothetical protein